MTDERLHLGAQSTVSRGLIQALRPRQWIKNVLVLAAPAAAGVLLSTEAVVPLLVTFVAFSLTSSSAYVFNDIADVDADRAHPQKRNRPIAAGAIAIPMAKALGVTLALAGVALGLSQDRRVGLLLVVYFITSMTYSAWLKHVAVVDILVVASGFVIRAAAGAIAVDVPVSQWFLTVMAFGALAMAAGKRSSELKRAGSQGASRPVLQLYNHTFLTQVETVAVGGCLVGYALWAFDTATVASAPLAIELSVIPIALAMLRYLLAVSNGEAEAPEQAIFADPVLAVAAVAWIALFLVGIGW